MIKRILIIITVIILIIILTNYFTKLIPTNEGFSFLTQKRRRALRSTAKATTTTKSLSQLAAPIINRKTKTKSTFT